MVTLSPRFTFLATICALAALSSAPVSDAAVLRLHVSDPALANMAPGHWFRSHSSRVADQPPVLPLPKSPVESHKNSADSSISPNSPGNKNDRKIPSAGGSHGEKDVSSDDDDGNVHEEGGKVKDRRWNPFRSITRLSQLWFSDNHVHYSRAPHHRHHHHHHHHDRYRRNLGTVRQDRDLPAPGISGYVSGDHDHVHVGRSPHHNHHHHHHYNGHEKVIVSGDHDHVRVGRSPIPHHHHHHHGGHEKVIITGDHDHVRVDRSSNGRRGFEDEKVTTSRDNGHDHLQRSVFIAGEQGQSYVVPRVAKRSATQKLFTLGKRAGDMDGVPGRIDIMSPTDDVSGGKRIASLVLASSNSTTSEDSATSPSAFVLNASDINGTQVYLLQSSSNSSKSMLTPDEINVTIRLEMFDITSASNVPYCATYDPDPPAPAPLTAEECTEDPVGKRRSQMFAFHRTTGVVRPMWFNAQDSGKDECIDDVHRAAPQNASLPSVTEADSNHINSTSSADRVLTSNITVLAADPSRMTSSNGSEGSIQRAQNVALVFVATNPEVMDTPAGANTTVGSVLATTMTAMASSSPGSLATSSSAVTSSSSSSASSAVPSAGSNTSVASSGTLASVPSPSSPAPVSGAAATSMVLGVQVIPESASQVASTTSSSATPTVTPVNTQPYDWMFYPDS